MNIGNMFSHISHIGIRENTPLSEKKQVIILNQMCFVLLLSMTYFLFHSIKDGNIFDTIINSGVALFSILTISLQKWGKFRLARLIMVLTAPLIISAFVILFGPKVGAEVLYVVVILAVVFFFSSKKDHFFLIAWIVFLFIVSQIMTTNYDPPFVERITGNGRLILLLLAATCSYLMLTFFLKENRIYEIQTDKLLDQLQGKNQELNELNEELERYFHIATHDLKTPLRTTIGFLGLIKRKIKSNEPDKVIEYVDLASQGGEQMLQKINHLLTYSKVSQKKEQIVWINLKEMLQEYAFQSKQYLEAQKVDLQVHNQLEVKGKPFQIYSLLQNLIENGIKYNQQEVPRIEIFDLKEGSDYILAVRDNGIGISEKNQEKIFEMFGRLHTDEEYEGSGIGLSLCKKIVQLHNGKIWVESELGKGSTFFIQFPAEILCIKPVETTQTVSVFSSIWLNNGIA